MYAHTKASPIHTPTPTIATMGKKDHNISIFVNKAYDAFENYSMEWVSDLSLDDFTNVIMLCPFLAGLDEASTKSLYDVLCACQDEGDTVLKKYATVEGIRELLKNLADDDDFCKETISKLALVCDRDTAQDRANVVCAYIVLRQAAKKCQGEV